MPKVLGGCGQGQERQPQRILQDAYFLSTGNAGAQKAYRGQRLDFLRSIKYNSVTQIMDLTKGGVQMDKMKVVIYLLYFLVVLFDIIIISDARRLLLDFLIGQRNRKNALQIHSKQTFKSHVL